MTHDRLKSFLGSDWAEWIGPWFKSKEWERISGKLKQMKEQGEKIVPVPSNIFRCFKECPFYNLHTIILTDNCYPILSITGKPLADGIAFSAKDSIYCPKPLENILYALDDTQTSNNVEQISYTDDYDLKRWANQGILLLNCRMTTTIDNLSKEHLDLWEPFIVYLLDRLDMWKQDLNIIAMGAQAERYLGIIGNPSHYKMSCEDPYVAAILKKKWEHENVFLQLIDNLKKQNIIIQW